MSKFESSIKHIPYPQTAVYAMLSDLSNLEKVRDKLPEDKIKDLSFDRDSLSISAPMGSVAMKIVEREEPKCIKFATTNSPIAANLWIQVVPEGDEAKFDGLSDAYSHLYLAISGELAAVVCISDPLRAEAADAVRDIAL